MKKATSATIDLFYQEGWKWFDEVNVNNSLFQQLLGYVEKEF
jgi:hypothetical protein